MGAASFFLTLQDFKSRLVNLESIVSAKNIEIDNLHGKVLQSAEVSNINEKLSDNLAINQNSLVNMKKSSTDRFDSKFCQISFRSKTPAK